MVTKNIFVQFRVEESCLERSENFFVRCSKCLKNFSSSFDIFVNVSVVYVSYFFELVKYSHEFFNFASLICMKKRRCEVEDVLMSQLVPSSSPSCWYEGFEEDCCTMYWDNNYQVFNFGVRIGKNSRIRRSGTKNLRHRRFNFLAKMNFHWCLNCTLIVWWRNQECSVDYKNM